MRIILITQKLEAINRQYVGDMGSTWKLFKPILDELYDFIIICHSTCIQTIKRWL